MTKLHGSLHTADEAAVDWLTSKACDNKNKHFLSFTYKFAKWLYKSCWCSFAGKV